MPNPEKYFLRQLQSHHCQLPPGEDFEYMKQVSRFKNFFLISEKNLQSFLTVKSLSAIFYEKRHQVRTTRVLVVHPFSQFQKLWNSWMFFVLLASLVLLPFSCAFHGPLYAKRLLAEGGSLVPFYTLLVLVFLLQLACLLHVLVTFVNGYFVPAKEEIVINLPGIAKHYLSTHFLPDFISSLPVDAVLVLFGGLPAYAHLSRTEATLLGILPLLKFSRLLTLNHYFRSICTRFQIPHSTYCLLVAIGFYFLFIHWTACLFMLVPRWLHFRSLFPDTDDPLHDSVTNQYVTCIYVSITTLTDTGIEKRQAFLVASPVLILFLIVFGKVYRVILLIVFLQFFSTLMVDKLRYVEMMDQVAQYMRIKKFPRNLRRKIILNYTYLFRKEHIQEKSILRLLSDNLRREVLLRMHDTLIHKVLFFTGLGDDLVCDFVSRFRSEIYLANDIVYRTGEASDSMYFISFGTVAVYSENKDEVCHLHDGDHFGEISVIFHIRRTATIIAVENTELYRLDAQDFLDVVKSHPAVYALMETQAKERYAESSNSPFAPESEVLRRKRRPPPRVADNEHDWPDPTSDSD